MCLTLSPLQSVAVCCSLCITQLICGNVSQVSTFLVPSHLPQEPYFVWLFVQKSLLQKEPNKSPQGVRTNQILCWNAFQRSCCEKTPICVGLFCKRGLAKGPSENFFPSPMVGRV
mmetsp:Transcript_52093/g.84156  ORF Transcript_52093/g.84156 Transcript_52093/m.84156 type:complete len:115 (-) Transcript_52093:244-588(-)